MIDELTPDELRAATGKAHPRTQASALARKGVPFTFTGQAVRVERIVAQAHDLLPQRERGGGVQLENVR